MTESEAHLRDKILKLMHDDSLNNAPNKSGIYNGFQLRKRLQEIETEAPRTLEHSILSMADDGYLKLIMNHPPPNGYIITQPGRTFILFHGGYTKQVEEENAQKETRSFNVQLGKSQLKTNCFIILTFGAVLGTIIVGAFSVHYTHQDAVNSLRQEYQLHILDSLKTLKDKPTGPSGSTQTPAQIK